jgi:large subunit ribosomal protein L29
MNVDEIREMSPEDMRLELDDAREELMRMRFQMTTGELSDFNRLAATRKKIARLITVLKESTAAGVEESK